MRNILIISISALTAIAAFIALQRHFELNTVRAEAQELTTERDALLRELRAAEAARVPAQTPISAKPVLPSVLKTDTVEKNAFENEIEPVITENARGKKSYFFKNLYSADGEVIARQAQFRELLGFSKLAFKTSEGTRYFGLDDLHPRVLASLGYNAEVLHRRIAEEQAQMRIRGAHAQLQQELRAQAAVEHAARETAASEKARAEAALREAHAKERLASLAEGYATHPPKPPQVNVRVINVDRN